MPSTSGIAPARSTCILATRSATGKNVEHSAEQTDFVVHDVSSRKAQVLHFAAGALAKLVKHPCTATRGPSTAASIHLAGPFVLLRWSFCPVDFLSNGPFVLCLFCPVDLKSSIQLGITGPDSHDTSRYLLFSANDKVDKPKSHRRSHVCCTTQERPDTAGTHRHCTSV